MFNASFTENAAPAGIGVLELIVDPNAPIGDDVIERPPRPAWGGASLGGLAPLERTELRGTITGPLASFQLVQRFRMPRARVGTGPIEARYRFPLPGDAAVVGVVVRFGDVTVRTALREREAARTTYETARAAGHQAALLERESPNVFTLSITGLRDAESVEVETRYVQRALLAGGRWSVRIPLTTAPRFVRTDEWNLPQANANPLAVLRDPGHRFALDVTVQGATGALAVSSPTHALLTESATDGTVHVRLRDGETVPDRDCVLEWRPNAATLPALHVVTEDADAYRYAMALVTPPAASAGTALPRDLLLLVDRSGSMEGAKWEATRWAVRRVLAGLAPTDHVQLGLFDDQVMWLDAGLRGADEATRKRADAFLDKYGPNGGTELGAALENALLARPRAPGSGVARHCLVVTDGQVTDEGRVLSTVDNEAKRIDARRVSVLCIDSAPNASLAVTVAEHGRGTAHFLSSDPSDGDVATALEDVLEAFDAPLATGLTLTIDTANDASLPVAHPSTRIDLGDLVTGRSAWVVFRVPATEARDARLRVAGHGMTELVAPLDGVRVTDGSVRAAFGAERVRVLEQLATGITTVDVLRRSLRALDYDPDALGIGEGSTVYAENALIGARAALKALIARESLAAGVPSTATAFVAVREIAGQVVQGTVDVASALPAGWDGAFASGRGGYVGGAFGAPPVMMSPAPAPMAPPAAALKRMRSAAPPSGSVLGSLAELASDMMSAVSAIPDMLRGGDGPKEPVEPDEDDAYADESDGLDDLDDDEMDGDVELWIGVPQSVPNGDIVLFDSDAASDVEIPAHITSVTVILYADATVLPAGARLLLYVGDLARPVARIDIAATLAAGGERPLNVQRMRGERVRLVLDLGGAAWPSEARLRVLLGD